MSATIVGLSQRGGIRWSFSGDGNRTYFLNLTVTTTTAPNLIATAVALKAALDAAGFKQGEPCPLDTTALCTDVDPECTQRRDVRPSPYWEWSVKVQYSSSLGDFQPSDQKNPLDRPPIFEVSGHTWTEAATEDIDAVPVVGRKVQNSAGDPQVRQKMRSRLVLSVEKNYANFNMQYANEADGDGLKLTRNQAGWTFDDAVIGNYVITAGSARMEDIRIAKRFDNATPYAAVSMRIEFDDHFWADLFPDMGFFYQGTNAYGRPVTLQFSDGAGRLSPTPKFLDGAGHPLPAGSNPYINSFQYYPKADWSVLALPGMP